MKIDSPGKPSVPTIVKPSKSKPVTSATTSSPKATKNPTPKPTKNLIKNLPKPTKNPAKSRNRNPNKAHHSFPNPAPSPSPSDGTSKTTTLLQLTTISKGSNTIFITNPITRAEIRMLEAKLIRKGNIFHKQREYLGQFWL